MAAKRKAETLENETSRISCFFLEGLLWPRHGGEGYDSTITEDQDVRGEAKRAGAASLYFRDRIAAADNTDISPQLGLTEALYSTR